MNGESEVLGRAFRELEKLAKVYQTYISLTNMNMQSKASVARGQGRHFFFFFFFFLVLTSILGKDIWPKWDASIVYRNIY